MLLECRTKMSKVDPDNHLVAWRLVSDDRLSSRQGIVTVSRAPSDLAAELFALRFLLISKRIYEKGGSDPPGIACSQAKEINNAIRQPDTKKVQGCVGVFIDLWALLVDENGELACGEIRKNKKFEVEPMSGELEYLDYSDTDQLVLSSTYEYRPVRITLHAILRAIQRWDGVMSPQGAIKRLEAILEHPAMVIDAIHAPNAAWRRRIRKNIRRENAWCEVLVGHVYYGRRRCVVVKHDGDKLIAVTVYQQDAESFE